MEVYRAKEIANVSHKILSPHLNHFSCRLNRLLMLLLRLLLLKLLLLLLLNLLRLSRKLLLMNVFHVPAQIISILEVCAANVAVKGFSTVAVNGRLMAAKIKTILKILFTNFTMEERRRGGAVFRMEVSHVAFQVKVAVEILVAQRAIMRRGVADFAAS